MMKMLIIDDDEMMLAALTAFFRSDDCEIMTSKDGFEGIELFRTKKPDVVLIDLSMPSIHGFDVLDSIMEIDPNAKIVIITGYASSEVEEKSMKKGAVGFFDKSKDVETLKELIDRAVGA